MSELDIGDVEHAAAQAMATATANLGLTVALARKLVELNVISEGSMLAMLTDARQISSESVSLLGIDMKQRVLQAMDYVERAVRNDGPGDAP